jgi:D-glycero-D-manno-heptose 1,7-bisphosphate phosphatase
MRKAIFLDRDGVVNRDIGDYTYRMEDYELLPGLIDFLKARKEEGFDFVVITNQAGIEKGLYGHDEVKAIHERITADLEAHGLDILEYYYAPYHENYSRCLSRKPGSIMVEKALARFQIDPEVSWMIGDRPRDLEAAEKAGVRNLLLVDANSDLNKNWNDIEY